MSSVVCCVIRFCPRFTWAAPPPPPIHTHTHLGLDSRCSTPIGAHCTVKHAPPGTVPLCGGTHFTPRGTEKPLVRATLHLVGMAGTQHGGWGGNHPTTLAWPWGRPGSSARLSQLRQRRPLQRYRGVPAGLCVGNFRGSESLQLPSVAAPGTILPSAVLRMPCFESTGTLNTALYLRNLTSRGSGTGGGTGASYPQLILQGRALVAKCPQLNQWTFQMKIHKNIN